MKLDTKMVTIAGAAFLVGFYLCYCLMSSAPSKTADKRVSVKGGGVLILTQSTDLRTDITFQILSTRKGEINLHRYGSVNNIPPPYAPGMKQKTNQDLIDFDYAPKDNLKELLLEL
jgi:hypothetical protein